MASIAILPGVKNLAFAAAVAEATGAEFRETGQSIIIEDIPTLTIPRYCFDNAFDPANKRQGQVDYEGSWRSLLLNKVGYLVHLNEMEIVISDEKPPSSGKVLLILPPDVKDQAEFLAAGLHQSLNSFIKDAVANWIAQYEQTMGKREERAETTEFASLNPGGGRGLRPATD